MNSSSPSSSFHIISKHWPQVNLLPLLNNPYAALKTLSSANLPNVNKSYKLYTTANNPSTTSYLFHITILAGFQVILFQI